MVSRARLLAMINESNVQKTRYEMEDDPNAGLVAAFVQLFVSGLCSSFGKALDEPDSLAQGGKRIRAISKSRSPIGRCPFRLQAMLDGCLVELRSSQCCPTRDERAVALDHRFRMKRCDLLPLCILVSS